MDNEASYELHIEFEHGDPTGLRKVRKDFWHGNCLICPRNLVDRISNEDRLKRPGVYILIGEPVCAVEGRIEFRYPDVYIGSSANVGIRLGHHYHAKEFWNEAIIFTSDENGFTEPYFLKLESNLIKIAKELNAWCCEHNKSTPKDSQLPSRNAEHQVNMYLEKMKELIALVGIDVFRVQQELRPRKSLDKKHCSAVGYNLLDGRFVVFRGSRARKKLVYKTSKSLKQIRRQLTQRNSLVPAESADELTFEHNCVFSSEVEAAVVVTGTYVNPKHLDQFWVMDEG